MNEWMNKRVNYYYYCCPHHTVQYPTHKMKNWGEDKPRPMNEWTNEWTNGWMNEQTSKLILLILLLLLLKENKGKNKKTCLIVLLAVWVVRFEQNKNTGILNQVWNRRMAWYVCTYVRKTYGIECNVSVCLMR